MNLSELTDRIYAEGVEKGNAEAQRILDEANQKAAQIVADAQKKADETLAKAERKAQELDAHTKAELKLYTGQALNALKTSVVDMLNGEIVKSNVKAATADAKFMQGLIAKLAELMVKDGDVKIEAKDADALRKYFAGNAKELLNKGVKIEQVNGLKADFQIVSHNGEYKLTFGDAEFEEYFKAFLRPQLVELLF